MEFDITNNGINNELFLAQNNAEIQRLNKELEDMKEKCRELSLRYERYMNDYQSQYQESIENYGRLQNRIAELRSIEDKYCNLVKTIKQIRRIATLYDSVYVQKKEQAKRLFKIVTLPQSSSVLVSTIVSFLDWLLEQHPIFDWKQRERELKQEEENRKEFYDLISTNRYGMSKKLIFEFIRDNIKEMTPNPIQIFLLLSKKHGLLKVLPTPTQVRDHFGITEQRMKKLYGYEGKNIDEDSRKGDFKPADILQIENSILEFKKKYDYFNF